MGMRGALVALLCMLLPAAAAGKELRKRAAMTLTSPVSPGQQTPTMVNVLSVAPVPVCS